MVAKELISRMRGGSVIVDVAIDQGGCVETSHITSFDKPVFQVDGVLHYCVANMPSCVTRTSTYALANATFPYILKLANLGHDKAMRQDTALKKGLNVFKGKLVNEPVAEAVGIDCTPYETIAA
jgi:alanine dehydrogenase